MYKDEQLDGGLSAAAVEEFVLEHGNTVLRVARSYCKSPQDADDVYQRTLELVMTRAPVGIGGRDLVAWACKVAKNESLMIGRARKSSFATDFDSLADALESELPSPDELFEDEELMGQGRDILAQLRPDQARCLLLRAEEMSYPDICDLTGFSYAKVNRLLSEGRKAMRVRHEMLVSGNDCRRIEELLSAYADNVADDASVQMVEAHLEHCLGCKATLRDYRHAPDRLAGVLPIGLLLGLEEHRGWFARAMDHVESVYANVQERLFGHAAAGQQSAEIATAKKIAIVAAVGGTLIAGGAAIENGGGNGDAGEAGRPVVKPAAQTPRLVDPIVLTAADRRAVAAARRRARAATDSDLLARGADGKPAFQAASPRDQAVEQDQAGYAADPADQAPAGADNTREPTVNGPGL